MIVLVSRLYWHISSNIGRPFWRIPDGQLQDGNMSGNQVSRCRFISQRSALGHSEVSSTINRWHLRVASNNDPEFYSTKREHEVNMIHGKVLWGTVAEGLPEGG